MKTSRIFVSKMMIILIPVFVVLSNQAEAIIYPIASSLNLHAEANAGAGLVARDNGMSQTTALNPLSASVLANPVLGLSNGVYTFTDTNQTGPATNPKFFRVLEH